MTRFITAIQVFSVLMATITVALFIFIVANDNMQMKVLRAISLVVSFAVFALWGFWGAPLMRENERATVRLKVQREATLALLNYELSQLTFPYPPNLPDPTRDKQNEDGES